MDNIYLELAQSCRQYAMYDAQNNSLSSLDSRNLPRDNIQTQRNTEFARPSSAWLSLKHRIVSSSLPYISCFKRRLLLLLSLGKPEINALNGLPETKGRFGRGGLPLLLQRGIESHIEGNRHASRHKWSEALVMYQRSLKSLIKFYGPSDNLMIAKTHEKIGVVHYVLRQLHLAYDSFGASLKIHESLLEEPGDERFVPLLNKLYLVRLEMKNEHT